VAGDGIGHILTHLPLMQQKFSLRCYDKSFRLFRACACVKNAYFRQLCQNVAQFYYKKVYIFLSLYRFPPPFTHICLDDGGWKK